MSTPYALLYWLTLVGYALAIASQLFGHVFDRPRAGRAALWGVVGGLGLHTALVAWRWGVTGHIPVIGTFENALLGAWFIVLVVLWAGWRDRFPLLAAGSLPFALIILGYGGMSDTAPSPLVASLQSFWLYIHIFFAWLAYAAYTVACGAGVVYLARTRRTEKAGTESGDAPADSSEGKKALADSLERLDELMFRATTFGFITDAIMIAAGSIWAKNLWGSYWGWDPVETWSLLSWLCYGLALHLRTTMNWRGRRLAWVLVAAVVTVLISFWGVNLVMEGSAHVFNVD